jgi:hypothetical protein
MNEKNRVDVTTDTELSAAQLSGDLVQTTEWGNFRPLFCLPEGSKIIAVTRYQQRFEIFIVQSHLNPHVGPTMARSRCRVLSVRKSNSARYELA